MPHSSTALLLILRVTLRHRFCLSSKRLSSPQSLLQGLCDGDKLELLFDHDGLTCRVPSRETLRRRIQQGDLHAYLSTTPLLRIQRMTTCASFWSFSKKVAFPAESPSGTLRWRINHQVQGPKSLPFSASFSREDPRHVHESKPGHLKISGWC